jgi:hypothetical protein
VLSARETAPPPVFIPAPRRHPFAEVLPVRIEFGRAGFTPVTRHFAAAHIPAQRTLIIRAIARCFFPIPAQNPGSYRFLHRQHEALPSGVPRTGLVRFTLTIEPAHRLIDSIAVVIGEAKGN